MSEIPFQQQSVIWGQAYEILVKRGVLACLVERKILLPDHPSLADWRENKLLQVSSCVVRELDILDDAARHMVGREDAVGLLRRLAGQPRAQHLDRLVHVFCDRRLVDETRIRQQVHAVHRLASR